MDSVRDVIDALRRAPDIVLPLVQEVPPRILKRRPAPRRWSAHEHACHLVGTGRELSRRVDRMNGRQPQPTAARFVDLLFPATRPLPRGWEPDAVAADHAIEGASVQDPSGRPDDDVAGTPPSSVDR
jgi:hypothetical protein